ALAGHNCHPRPLFARTPLRRTPCRHPCTSESGSPPLVGPARLPRSGINRIESPFPPRDFVCVLVSPDRWCVAYTPILPCPHAENCHSPRRARRWIAATLRKTPSLTPDPVASICRTHSHAGVLALCDRKSAG